MNQNDLCACCARLSSRHRYDEGIPRIHRSSDIEGSHLHRQITGLQWSEQTSGALKEDPSQPNHSTDCLLYAREVIAGLFESGVVNDSAREGASTSTYDDPMGLDDDSGGDPFELLSMDDFDQLDGRF